MPQSAVEMTQELVLAQIQTGQLQAEQVQDALRQTHASLAELKAQEDIGTTTVTPTNETPPVDWRKSITKHAVTCLACGQSFKQLSVRHLMIHGLDGRSYRAKYGIPPAQPLAAKTTTARRREVVQETRPWEKTLTFLKGQEHNSHVSPEAEAEVQRDEIKEPTAAAPAQPKRQRKTTPKKTARKQTSAG